MRLAATDYTLTLLIASETDPEKTRRFLQGGNVDGALILSHHSDDTSYVKLAAQHPRRLRRPPDEPGGGCDLLRGRGQRRGVAGGDRVPALARAHQDRDHRRPRGHGGGARPRRRVAGRHRRRAGWSPDRWSAATSRRPAVPPRWSACWTAGSGSTRSSWRPAQMAFGALGVLRARGRAVPEDVAIATVDNDYFAHDRGAAAHHDRAADHRAGREDRRGAGEAHRGRAGAAASPVMPTLTGGTRERLKWGRAHRSRQRSAHEPLRAPGRRGAGGATPTTRSARPRRQGRDHLHPHRGGPVTAGEGARHRAGARSPQPGARRRPIYRVIAKCPFTQALHRGEPRVPGPASPADRAKPRSVRLALVVAVAALLGEVDADLAVLDAEVAVARAVARARAASSAGRARPGPRGGSGGTPRRRCPSRRRGCPSCAACC